MGKKAYAWAESDVLEFHFREALTELSELLECIKEYKAKGDDACLGFIDRHGLATKVEHVYHHLNTGWNGRRIQDLQDPIFEKRSTYRKLERMPRDLGSMNPKRR